MRRVADPSIVDRFATAPPDVGATFDVLLDANVINEIYTFGDLEREGRKHDDSAAVAASPTYEYRRRRARASMLLAWWLAKHRKGAACLGPESVEIITTVGAPPSSEDNRRLLTVAFLYVVLPQVLRGWRLGACLNADQQVTGDRADSELLGIALREKKPIITNEGLTEHGVVTRRGARPNLRGRCMEAGVPVFTPSEYLDAERVDQADEAIRYVRALERVLRAADAPEVAKVLRTAKVREFVIETYRHVLLGEYGDVEPAVPVTSAATLIGERT